IDLALGLVSGEVPSGVVRGLGGRGAISWCGSPFGGVFRWSAGAPHGDLRLGGVGLLFGDEPRGEVGATGWFCLRSPLLVEAGAVGHLVAVARFGSSGFGLLAQLEAVARLRNVLRCFPTETSLLVRGTVGGHGLRRQVVHGW